MKRLDDWLRIALEWLVSVVLSLIAIICFVEVVLRYGFGSSFGWYDEFVGYLLVWLTFIGAVMAQQKRAHIGIDNVLDALPDRASHWLRIGNHVLMLAIHVILLIYGAQLANGVVGDRATTLPVPMSLVYSVIPMTALLMLFVETRCMMQRVFPSHQPHSESH